VPPHDSPSPERPGWDRKGDAASTVSDEGRFAPRFNVEFPSLRVSANGALKAYNLGNAAVP